jgi:hypothetical protein
MATVAEKPYTDAGVCSNTPEHLAYHRSVETLSKLQAELLRAKMERDVAQKRVTSLELDIATQQHVVTVLGAVEVP